MSKYVIVSATEVVAVLMFFFVFGRVVAMIVGQ